MSGVPHYVTLEVDGQPARGLEIGHSLRPDEYGLIVSISYTYFRE